MTFKVSFLYFLITFVVAFAFGVIRVTFIVPFVGDLYAVLLEVPLMILVSWIVSKWVMRRYFSNRSNQEYLAVGLMAFLFLMIAEYILAILFFNWSPTEFFSSLQTKSGFIGLLGQVGFGLVPYLQGKRKV